MMTAANEARLATFRNNGRLFKGVRWLATLDGHTCPRCAALDGQAWDLDGERLPGTKVDFLAPPIHFGDRCVLSPIPKTDALDAAQSRLSFHLKVLKDAGLVTDRREGRWMYYTVNAEALAGLGELVETMASAPSPAERRNGCC